MARSTVYNENLTSDYEKVSPQNRQLVKQYIQYCKSNDGFMSVGSVQRAAVWCEAAVKHRQAGPEQGCEEQSVRRALNGFERCVMHNSGGTTGSSRPDLA